MWAPSNGAPLGPAHIGLAPVGFGPKLCVAAKFRLKTKVRERVLKFGFPKYFFGLKNMGF